MSRAGIDFQSHEDQGIDVHEFGASIMMSGVVLNEKVKWVSFHSGYDFAYLLKALTCQPMPEDETEFFESLKYFFPVLFDVKYMMQSCERLHGGLQQLADDLKVCPPSVAFITLSLCDFSLHFLKMRTCLAS